MDIGRLIILISFAIYYVFVYKKDKKGINIFMIFVLIYGIIYRMPYSLYSISNTLFQSILDITFLILCLMIALIFAKDRLAKKTSEN